jgi:hypothetical protein
MLSRLLAAAFLVAPLPARGQSAVPDFRLADLNPKSARHNQTVSPRDYQLQISVYYFVGGGCSYCMSQYASLETVIQDVAAASPGLRVEAVAINRIADAGVNDAIIESLNSIPWLQDNESQRVWDTWGVEWRDIVVLDPFNRPLFRNNLTDHSLTIPENRATLTAALVNAANTAAGADSDSDGLPDIWERGWFGSLDPKPDDDPDEDGIDNLTEFAFASYPTDPASRPALIPYVAARDGESVLGVVFRRFSGSAARLVIEASPTADFSTQVVVMPALEVRNLHDGLGGAEARHELPAASFPSGNAFIRARRDAPAPASR